MIPFRLRSACCVFLVLFLFSVSAVSRAQSSDLADIRNYLTEIHRHLTNSYAFSGTVRSSKLLEDGKQELLLMLKKDDTDAVPYSKEASQDLANRLEGQSLQSIDDLVLRMKQTQQAVSGRTVDFLPAADVFAAGMIDGTGDTFSRILTLEDLKEIRDRLLGKGTSRSLGLHLSKENGRFRVIYVVFRSAAYRAGLRAGDEILNINGTDLSETTEKERNALLKADWGKTVNVTFTRDHWKKAHQTTLKQVTAGADTVESKRLPSNIGYVRLTRFGLTATGDLQSALQDLQDQGMESIILDLRNNPGGALPVAVSIADLFIEGDRVITTTNSNYELEGAMVRIIRKILGFEPLSGTRRAETESPFEKPRMCVLINGSSASASELTTGALQDHDRATIVGQRSYGKGIGQVAIPLTSSRGLGEAEGMGLLGSFFPSRFLYLTVMTYSLPSGRSIHNKGIQPDLPVSLQEYPEDTFEAILTLRSTDLLRTYVRDRITENKDRMVSLARYDHFEPERYPSFDQLHDRVVQKINSHISRTILRRELRRYLRNYLRLNYNKSFTVDLQNDPVLQQAILHLQK